MHFPSITAVIITLATAVPILADNVSNCQDSCKADPHRECGDVAACTINCIACTLQGLGVTKSFLY